MLALTPVPLTTAGERALFGELARWDTGGSVRAAVVASLPLGDEQVQRRISDAVLFVPEGIAVIRIAEVQRQSGTVVAVPEGPWTIAPETGTSQVLQLGGGGSTPLDGLMRAGMDTAMKLRRAGLEPGRIARVTILVGEVTGLDPADGDLGEGDLVARLEPRSLLLGIARASRYAGVDNPRLWTTADVRAALEALGLPGRGPSVEELNGEGFPYSPYVLRRPELLTPAAMAAARPAGSAAAHAPGAAAGSGRAEPPAAAREQPSPEAIAQAVAASAAAAHAAQAAEVAGAAAPDRPAAGAPAQRDTVAIDGPSTPASAAPTPAFSTTTSSAPAPTPSAATPAAPATAAAPPEDAGLGGLFGRDQQAAPRTSVFPVTPAAAPGPPPPSSGGAFSYWTESSTPSPSDDDEDQDDEGPRRRTALLVAAAIVVLVLVGLGAWYLLGVDRDRAGGGPDGGTAAEQTADPGPVAGDVQEVAGIAYTLQAVQVDDTCAGHAYGEVAEFLATTDCTGLSRALYSAQLPAGPVVVSVVRVRMPDTAVARDLRALTDRNGSGNVSDLLREGVGYAGGPEQLSGAEYASALSGTTVTIVESAWVEPGAGPSTDIDRVAGDALALQVPPMPGA